MQIILARTVFAIFIVLLLACSEVSEQEKVASVRQQFEQAKYSEAALKAKAILEQNPSAGEARYLLGASLLALGDLAASEIELKKSLELEYSSDQVIPVLAKVMLARRSLKQLTEAYGDTELESPEASNSLKTTLALAFAQLGNTDRANSLLSLVLSKIPDHVPATLVKARLLAGGSNFRRALQLLDNLLTKEPNNADVLLLKADITLISDDNPLLAAELYKKVLQIKRKDVDAHFALAAIFLNQQDLIAAQRQIADLSSIAPSSPQTKFFEAQLAYLLRDYAKAKSAIQEILRIDRKSVV